MQVNLLGKLHNYIYANEGLGRQEAFDEVIKILLIKIFDEKEKLNHFFVTKNEERKGATFEKRLSELQKYSEVEKINLSTPTLIYAVKLLQKERLKSNKNLAGEVFQEFIANNQKAERGQFFTPKEIVRLAVGIINPKSDEVVLDPACGGGGFLIETINYLGHDFIPKNILGVEINPRVAQIAKLGLNLMQGDESQIKIANSLKESDQNVAEVILANPPFGTKGRVRERLILDKYNLAKKNKSMVPEILFIERCFNLLKSGGRMAIVLPNGVLEGNNNRQVRKYLLGNFRINQIVDLPESTFAPYGTNVKTSLLILTKSERTRGPVVYGKFEKGKVTDKFKTKQEKIQNRLDYQFNRPGQKGNQSMVSLGEVIEIASKEKTKKTLDKVKYVEISGINAVNFSIDFAREMTMQSLPKRAQFQLKKGDILVSLVGNYLGTKRQAVAIVEQKFDGAWCSNGIAVIRKSKIDPYYLLYFFRSKLFLKQVNKHKTQTTIPRIRAEDLVKIKINVLKDTEMRILGQKVRKFVNFTRKAQRAYEKAFDEV